MNALPVLSVLAVIVAVPLLLIVGASLGSIWCKNVFRAGDKTLAAFLGFNGFFTLSAECGRCQVHDSSRLWGTYVRFAIDSIFGKGHCIKAAIKEKLVVGTIL